MIRRGKWSVAGIPHKGWHCIDIEDLEDGREICEMCESQEIRFVHYMAHPNYPVQLACGCDCAGHMEGNLAKAEERDRKMRSSASRRRNFPKLKSWKLSHKGNWTIKKSGNRVTIFGTNGRYKFVINHFALPDGKFSRTEYDSINKAKLAAFDALIWLEENWKDLLPRG